jgi:hypothetical protein
VMHFVYGCTEIIALIAGGRIIVVPLPYVVESLVFLGGPTS